jgi:RNA polymerase sigma factor (sigma-70 family)
MSQTSTDDFSPATRSSLLSRVRHASDAESWKAFHSQYERMVYQVCLKAGLNKEDAEDVAQETLAAVAAKMPEFELDRTKGSFRGWLYRITSNKVADFMRKKYREGAVRVQLPEGDLEATADHADLLEKAWDEEWCSYMLLRALERVKEHVSARSMQIFHLSAVKGWGIDQIRSTLGLGRTPVYLARYRVGLLIKKEIARLRKELE